MKEEGESDLMILIMPRTISSHASQPLSLAGLVSKMCVFNLFMWKSTIMHDNQVGQLDPSRVSIVADPDGGKLIEGAMWYCLF